MICYLQDIEHIASCFVINTSVEMTHSFEQNINEGRKTTLTLGLMIFVQIMKWQNITNDNNDHKKFLYTRLVKDFEKSLTNKFHVDEFIIWFHTV